MSDYEQPGYAPTTRRIADALQSGDLPISRDLAAAVYLATLFLMLRLSAGPLTHGLGQMMASSLQQIPSETSLAEFGFRLPLLHFAGIVLVPLSAATATYLLQTGGRLFAVTIDFQRLVPGNHHQQLNWVDAATVVKWPVMLLIWISLAVSALHTTLTNPSAPKLETLLLSNQLLLFCFCCLVMGSLDYLLRWWIWWKRQHMQSWQIREETRDREGNPQVQQVRHRQRHQLLESVRTAGSIRSGDLLVTGGNRLVVGLRRDGSDHRVCLRLTGPAAKNFLQRYREGGKTIQNDQIASKLYRQYRNGSVIDEKLAAELLIR